MAVEDAEAVLGPKQTESGPFDPDSAFCLRPHSWRLVSISVPETSPTWVVRPIDQVSSGSSSAGWRRSRMRNQPQKPTETSPNPANNAAAVTNGTADSVGP